MSDVRGAGRALSAAERRALDALDADALVAFLRRLIAIPSLDGAESEAQRAASADPWIVEHPPTVEWWGGRFDPAVTDPSDPIVATVVDAATVVTGSPPIAEGVTYGADMRLLVNGAGIPTVLFGPGDVRVAHMPDEYAPIDQLRLAAGALVLAALRFCGVEE